MAEVTIKFDIEYGELMTHEDIRETIALQLKNEFTGYPIIMIGEPKVEVEEFAEKPTETELRIVEKATELYTSSLALIHQIETGKFEAKYNGFLLVNNKMFKEHRQLIESIRG